MFTRVFGYEPDRLGSNERKSTMFTRTKIAVSAVVIVAAAAAALAAADNSGEYTGGFVIEGSTDGVNPAYHPMMIIGEDGHVRAGARPTESRTVDMMTRGRGHMMGRSMMLWRDDKGMIHVCSDCAG
jgi:hypothetical protein